MRDETEFQTWAWDQSRASGVEKMVLLAVAFLADRGGSSRFTVDQLAEMVTMSRRTVQRSLRSLADRGELKIALWPGGGPNLYTVICREYEPEPEKPKPPRYPAVPIWLRLKVFVRDGFECVVCGALHDLTIDHIWPQSKGGTNEEGNLQTLCRTCNSRKGSRTE